MQYKYCSCYYMKTSPQNVLLLGSVVPKQNRINFNFFMRLLGQWDFKGFWPLFLWDFKGFQPCFCGFGNDSSTCSFGISKDSRPSFCGFGNDSKPCSDSKPCLFFFFQKIPDPVQNQNKIYCPSTGLQGNLLFGAQ